MHIHSQRYNVRPERGSRCACGASKGERGHLTPEVRDAAVWPHLWFRFPKLLTPSSQCTCRVPIDPLPRPFHHREYMALLAGPVRLIATERHDRTGRLATVATLRPRSAVLPLSGGPLLLSKGKIRLTEHKHFLPESQAAPLNAEIKHCCLHATMNNEAITPDRQATAAWVIYTSNLIGCCTCETVHSGSTTVYAELMHYFTLRKIHLEPIKSSMASGFNRRSSSWLYYCLTRG